MTQPETSKLTTFRYSPLPIDGYQRTLGDKSFGPANSKLLDLPQVWNLAYLSFSYEDLINHPDAHFTANVRRTTQMCLNAKGLGLAEDPKTLVGSFLDLPAPRFVRILEESPELVATLPMFKAYGQEWVNTITRRAKGCGWEPRVTDQTVTTQGIAIYTKALTRAQDVW